jgi:bifunctional non-homologous end joining protein LigD
VAGTGAGDKIAVQVDGRPLTLTNLAKVLYPEDGFTKAEVLDYYQQISPVLLPHIIDRPMTLRRYPHGVGDLSFFAKHAPDSRPDWLRTEEVVSHSSRARLPGTPVRYLVVDDLPTLIWAVNLAALELHVPMWRFANAGSAGSSGSGESAEPAEPVASDGSAGPAGSAGATSSASAAGSTGSGGAAGSGAPADPEIAPAPDLLVFDLDPGAPATIVECCRVAEALRPVLEADGLRPLPKTSGGKGLQLYAPLSGMTAEQASELALSYAQRVERELPRLVVSRMTKSARTAKVFIDWSQNNESKTTIAPYSLRGRDLPTVSTPVSWDEVAACRKVADLTFTAPEVLARVATHGDLFAPLIP